MKRFFAATSLITALALPALAAPEKYALDPSHSQIVFSYNHLGFSTTYGMFSGFEGEIMFDADAPAESSVSVSMPLKSIFTGWEARDQHIMTDEFLGAQDGDLVTFTSTSIEVTGENTALITGDLTIKGITKPVVLDSKLNQAGDNPMEGKAWLGFDATTTLKRSDFGAGAFAPFIADEMNVIISIEAGKS